MNRRCSFEYCFTDTIADRDLCLYHRAQEATGSPLGIEPLASRMWLIEVASGWDPGRDEHGCIVWPFQRNQGGYGVSSRVIDGRRTGTNASRLLCEFVNGSPPSSDWHAAHTCGRGKQGCVTPEHLTWKTAKDNNADKAKHGTSSHGSRNNKAKLTEDQVWAILGDKRPETEIVADYPIGLPALRAIKKGQTWARVHERFVAEGNTVVRTKLTFGERNHNAKLTFDQVLEIRASDEPTRVLAERYDSSEPTIWAIRTGRSRLHS